MEKNSSLTKKYLFENYIEQNRNVKDIAIELGLHYSTIYLHLKKYNVKRPEKTLIGQEFGNLKVIEITGTSRCHHRIYKCQCDCGNSKSILGNSLVQGQTTSCGCAFKRRRKTSFNWKGYGDIHMTFWSRIRKGAESRKICFDIEIEYAWGLYEKQKGECNISGIPISFSETTNEHIHGKTTASLDRIDNKKGYIKNNVHWVHKDINRMKTDLPLSRFLYLCKAISQHDDRHEFNKNRPYKHGGKKF